MSSTSSNASPRRKSKPGLFNRSSSALSPLSPLTQLDGRPSTPDKSAAKAQKKKSNGSKLSAAFSPSGDSWWRAQDGAKASRGDASAPGSPRPSSAAPSSSLAGSDSPQSSRPSLAKRARPSSIFGSLRSLRFGEDDETPPQTATSLSSQAPSVAWKEFGGAIADIPRSNTVLHHGEAQTSGGWFWKKREYLVLTETHLIRYKTRGKANEAFPSIPPLPTRQDLLRHSSSRSIDSTLDQQSLHSDVSSEKAAGIALEAVVAVYLTEDSRSLHTLEMSYLDSDSGHSSSITLQFTDADERDLWLRSIREIANQCRLSDPDPVPMKLAEYISRVVEREQDYEPTNIKIYKIVKRAASRSNGRASADDFAKVAPTVCYLVIGLNKVHIIPLPKNALRGSTSSLSEFGDGGSFGILTLTWISVGNHDDSFALAFRFPFQAPTAFSVASLASSEIAMQLRQRDSFLRPEWLRRPFGFTVPPRIEDEPLPNIEAAPEDLNCFERTLTAFCVAYGVNPVNICYSVNYFAEDSPQFELLPAAYSNRKGYTALDLLAVLRSLRYNEHFKSISFARVNLDALNGLRDYHGLEHLCTHTKDGSAIRVNRDELENASLLISEIRAIAVSSRSLRRLDFSYSMASTNVTGLPPSSADSGCEVVEALYPLCCDQATNVDWLCLNGMPLAETDIEYLVSMAANRACHLRALELSNCGLSDRSISLILDSLKAQANTLETIDISLNATRRISSDFQIHLEAFNYIRKIDFSNMAFVSLTEPVVPFEVLSQWRLEEIKLHGVPLNDTSIQSICRYVSSSKSEPLRDLILSRCSLNGRQVWDVMHALKTDPGTARPVHLDISENNLYDGHDHIVRGVARNLAPTHLSVRSIEYENDHMFAELIFALAQNKSIRYLDIAKVSLPGEASPETCIALEELFATNTTLEDIDISGELSRLEITKFGTGLIPSLKGLKKNTTLQVLKIQNQKLGLQGASALADVLRENKTLKQVHCECNGITLSGFTDLVNALAYNRTLLYLPSLEEGRNEALKQTAAQIKIARNKTGGNIMASPSKLSGVRRTFAKIGSGDGGSSSGAAKLGPVPQWSEQDVQAALRLVDEGWEGQMVRLEAFLSRNNKIAQGIPLDGTEDESEEETHRPSTAGSISKIMERVKMNSTPTAELFVELGSEQANESPGAHLTPPSSSALLSPPKFSLPAASTSPRKLSDVEIDTTPIFEKDSPFNSTSSQHTSTNSTDSSTADISLLPSAFAAFGDSVIELKLPSTKADGTPRVDL